MKRMRSKALILIFLFLSFACHQKNEQKEKSNVFDINLFLKKQIETLGKNKFYLNKKITHNGISENKNIQNTDWNKELALFKDLNLDTKRLLADFKSDTIIQDKNIFKIIFTPFDQKKEFKIIEISFYRKEVQKIKIAIGNENFLYSNHKILTYSPLNYYSIEGNQHTAIGQEINFFIKGEIYIP